MTTKCSVKNCKEEAYFSLSWSFYICYKHFEEIRDTTIAQDKSKPPRIIKGCNVLFKSGSGLIICGEKRVDGNQFLCTRCIKESEVTNDKKM